LRKPFDRHKIGGIIIEAYGEIDIGGVVLIEGVKKPEDRSGENTQHYGFPIPPIKFQNVEYADEKSHLPGVW
jgi:hypothetical protein